MADASTPYEPTSELLKGQAARPGGRTRWRGATVLEVEPGSPAALEGLEPGMIVSHVNGVELRDMIDWDWEADGPEVDLEGIANPDTPDEFEFECHIERDWGQDWGISFDGAVFDGMRICRNNCLFCFMKMLPRGMRRTLYMRDDDYRLSFLQGNFVTLTNLTDDDVERIVSHALSPLNVSLHAVSPDVRARLMGKRRHASHVVHVARQVRGMGRHDEAHRAVLRIGSKKRLVSIPIKRTVGAVRHDVHHASPLVAHAEERPQR